MGCPYLRFDESHCAGCRGWRCIAFGRKKKLSDISICQNEEEWSECPRYLDATVAKPSGIGSLGMPGSTVVASVPRATPLPAPHAIGCKYLGPPPGGACCYKWCYAGSVPLRTTKICLSPPSRAECKYYVDGIRRRLKPYDGR